MLVLALDTATASPAVAVVAPDGSIAPAKRVVHAARGHGEVLAVLVQQCLDEVGARPRDLRLVVIGRGPGPFTGLRVGLVTARTLGMVLGIPVVGVCTHDVLAAQARAAGIGGPLLVVTDALRREVHWSRYDTAGSLVEGPFVAAPGGLDAGTSAVIGAGAARYAEHFPGAVAGFDDPDPTVLARLGHERWSASIPSPAEPIYLRRPDAVPNPRPKAVLPR